MSETLHPETVQQLKARARGQRGSWPLHHRATTAAIRRFALGIGDDNPLWWSDDLEAAYAPPTFPYTGVSYGSWPTPLAVTNQPTVTLWISDAWRWHGRLWRDEAFSAVSQPAQVEERTEAGEITGLRVRERVLVSGERARPVAEFTRTTLTRAKREVSKVARPREQRRLAASVLKAVDRCYDEEPARRRGSVRRRWETARIGDKLGPIVKGPLTVTGLVSFAIAWGAPLAPTNRLWRQKMKNGGAALNQLTGCYEGAEGMHWDPDVYRAFGFDRGFDFAPQRVSWLAHLCTDWCGDEGMLVELDAKLLKPNFVGDVTWLRGVITRSWRTDSHGFVECELEGVNQDEELTTVARAIVRLNL